MHKDQEKNKAKQKTKQNKTKKECQALGNQLRTFSDNQD